MALKELNAFSHQFFDKKLQFIVSNKRFIIPILVVAILRLAIFTWIQLSINWRPDLFPFSSWSNTYTIWDGGWYNLISENWYNDIQTEYLLPVDQVFAFSPLFPALIRALGLLIGDFVTSQVILSSIFGIIWIPLFQAVAEQYLDTDHAFSATLIAAMFPIVFLFTSVGYAEGLFLTLTLSAIYLHLKKRYLYASIFLTAVTMTKIFGILLVVPLLLDNLLKKRFRDALLYLLPVLAQLSWFYYAYLRTGNFFAVLDAQTYWLNNTFIGQYVLPTLFQTEPNISLSLPFSEAYIGLVICLFGAFCLLTLKVRELDWKLALYSFLTFLVTICNGNVVSYPRYFSFIFPVWLLFATKKDRWLILTVTILAFADLISMYLFARWVFLG
ncbi:MAG: hypothetical protein NWF03_02610 [Candidatus Bathyarchaeota archaeon]|nr:hypothetical protein [Candidatus Bathyarchaeota archaeon]